MFSLLFFKRHINFVPYETTGSKDSFDDIFSFLRNITGEKNLTKAGILSIKATPLYVDLTQEYQDERNKADILVFDPKENDQRYVSGNLSWYFSPFVEIHFKTIKITIRQYAILYNNLFRHMRCWRLMGKNGNDEFSVIDSQFNKNLTKNDIHGTSSLSNQSMKTYYSHYYEIKKENQIPYSIIRLENLCKDSYHGSKLYPEHANIFSAAKLLFWGRIEPNFNFDIR